MNKFYFLLFTLALYACTPDANEIVNKAITQAGGELLEGKEIRFDFRDKQYRSARSQGRYLLERSFSQDSLELKDVLTNEGFERYINDTLVQVADSMAVRYENSVNSVHYFAYLPYGLNGDAVNKELLGEVTLKGQPYYKIKVWFDQKGGGTDYEDVFVYWIHKESLQVDYLAYEYHTNDGGMRFREAYNRRVISGIHFVDYRNFKPLEKETSLYDLDSLFNEDALELLSVIELEDVRVAPCQDCM